MQFKSIALLRIKVGLKSSFEKIYDLDISRTVEYIPDNNKSIDKSVKYVWQ